MNKLKNRFNLKFVKSAKLTDKILNGNIEGKNISVSKEFNKTKFYLNINIHHQLGIKGEINLKKESVLSKLKRAAGDYDNVIFDEDFDDSLLLSADQPLNLTAFLNQKLREKILNLAKQSSFLEITKSRLNFKIPLSFFKHDTGAASLIQLAVSVSNDMTEKKPVIQRLIENISCEKENLHVRLHNIQMLAENFTDDNEVLGYLKSLLNDNNENIQIITAKHLKKEGLEHLYELLNNQKKNKKFLNTDIIKFLGEKQHIKSIPLLIDIYDESEKYIEMDIHDLKIVILTALKDIADPSANDFLIKELNNDDNSLRDAAVKALALCGKKEALEPLIKLSKFIFYPSTSNLIQEAIGKIRSRLDPVDVDFGALSIAERSEKDGALSISNEEEKGGLSLTDDENNKKGLSQEGGV